MNGVNMATQSYLIAREEIIIRACKGEPIDPRPALQDLLEAQAIEHAQGGNHANRDLWGTIGVNVTVLGFRYPRYRDECAKLVGERKIQELENHVKNR
jgi:hypothetical protein